MANPKTFISYSWTSPDHESWVLNLATELREVGVDVILDKWDLKEGHDAIKFMEQMVSNPEIKKVILICDASMPRRPTAGQVELGPRLRLFRQRSTRSLTRTGSSQ